MTVKLSIIQTMRLNYLLAPPCCQAWFYVSSSRQWDWMTSWHHVARHCSMCHHPDNETEWPHGTALLPDMVLCVIIQTMRLNDLMALPCCQACNKAWIPWPECLNQLNYQDSLNALTPWLSSQPGVYAWWIIVLTPLWGGWGVVMLGLKSSSMSHLWVGRV